MLRESSVVRTTTALWRRFVSLLFAFAMFAVAFPVGDARAAEGSAPATQSPAAGSEAKGAQVIGAFVPVLPMEGGGTAYARVYMVNLGGVPTQKGSTATLRIVGMPDGVAISGVTPAPGDGNAGWECTVDACSYVDASGAGAQLPVGQSVEGLVKLSIPASSGIPLITDTEVAEMADASVSTGNTNDAVKARMDEIAGRLTRLSVTVGVQGDAAATSQATASYLGLTDRPGRARIVTVLSGKGTAAVGEMASWTLSLANTGGTAGDAPTTVRNVLPPGVGIRDVRVSGTGWKCVSTDSAVDSCTYTDSIPAGGLGAPLRISGRVSDNAVTDFETKWLLQVPGSPAFVPADGTFTASQPVAPDLGLQMVVGNQVVVPGSTIDVHVQVATYGGSTTKPVTFALSGIKGVSFVSLLPGAGKNGGFSSTDADGNPSSTPALDSCHTTTEGISCVAHRVRTGELLASTVRVKLPTASGGTDSSVVVQGVVSTENESESTVRNNIAAVPVVVQPANAPYPALMPAIRDSDGTWRAFGGETIKLTPGKESVFGYVVRNSGAAPFPAATQFDIRVYLQEGVDVTASGDWKCTSATFDAPQFSEQQRLGAATVAKSAGVGFDLDKPASKLEKQLLDQIKQQAEVTPIPNARGKVPGLDCASTLGDEVPVGGESQPLVLHAVARADSDASVAIWRAELSRPPLENAPHVDTSVVLTSARRGVSATVVADSVRAGSVSDMRLSLHNKGELGASHPAVILAVPAGLRLNRSGNLADGWSCVLLAQGISGGLAACTYSALPGGSQAPVAQFQLQADSGRTAPSSLESVALTDGARIGLAATSRVTVAVREPLNVKVTGPGTVNDVSIPVGGGDPAPTSVTLSAQSSSDGVSYSWRQKCAVDGEAGCTGAAPGVKWSHDNTQSATFVVPRVTRAVDLIIEVTVRDNGAIARALHTLHLVPRPVLKAPPRSSGAQGVEFRKHVNAGRAVVQTASVHTAAVFGVSAPVAGDGTPETTTTLPVVTTTIADGTAASSTTTVRAVPKSATPVEAKVGPVTPRVPSALAADVSAGSGSAAARQYRTRQMGDLSVRANVFGTDTVVVSPGGSVRSLAAVAGATNVVWSWSIMNAPASVTDDSGFMSGLSAAGASLDVAIPDGAAAGSVVTLLVTAVSGGRSASDILTVRVETDPSTAGMYQRIALDGVNRDRPLLIGRNGSATIGAAVDEGMTVVWSVQGDGVALSNGSSKGVTITSSGRAGTAWVTAEVRDANDRDVDAVTFPVVTAAGIPFASFCDELTSKVKNATSSLAGLDVSNELVDSPDCAFSQTVEFAEKSFHLGIADVTGVSGSIGPEGISITSGTVTTSAALPISGVTVRNIFVPFREGGAIGNISGYLSGTLAGSVTRVLHLEEWNIEGTVRVANGQLRYVVINGSKAGNSDSGVPDTTTPDGQSGDTSSPDTTSPESTVPDTTLPSGEPSATITSPTFAASGTLGIDGSVSLDASVSNLELFGTLTVNAQGSIEFPSDGNPQVSLGASLAEKVDLTDGVSLDEAALHITNDGISGEGKVSVERDGVAFTVGTSVDLSAEKQSFSFEGTIPELSPVRGFSLSDVALSGHVDHTVSGFAGKLTAEARDIAFAGGQVRVTEPSIEFGFDCTGGKYDGDTSVDGAETTRDESGCDASLGISAGLEVGTEIPVKGELEASLDSAKKSLTLEGSLDSVDFGSGVVLQSFHAKVAYEDDELSFAADGKMGIFGATVSASVLASKDDMVIRAGVAGLNPFGDAGLRLTAGEIVVVARSGGTKYDWVPDDKQLAEAVGDQKLLTGDIRFAAIVGMPEEFARVGVLTKGIVTLPTKVMVTGGVNFETGAVDLTASAPADNVDLAGTLTREGSDADWLWSFSLKSNHEINLIPGFDRLSLDEANFNITNKDEEGKAGQPRVSADGKLRVMVAAGSELTVGASARFDGTDDWELNVTGAIAGEDGGSWQLFPGLTLPAAEMSGSVSRINGEFNASLKVNQASDWRPVSSVTVRDLSVELGLRKSATDGWDFTFLLGGKLKVSAGSLVLPEMAVSGGFQDGVWFLQVEVGDETCHDVPVAATETQAATTSNVCERVISVTNGLQIIDATFRLQYDTDKSELSVGINGGLRILGFQIDANLKLSNKGLFLAAGVKNWELFDGGPTFSEMAVIFSTYQTEYTLASGYKTTVPGMDVTLIAQMAVPDGIKATVGDVQLEPLKISLRGLLTGNIDIRIGIVLPPDAWIFKAGGYGLRLASVGLQLSIRNFAELTVGIYGEARLLVPNQTDQVPGRISISFAATGTLSINMSIGLDQDGNAVPWQNVFGIDGLTINFAAFSFGINFASTPIPTPEIGMAVSFQLPRALRNLVGMEDGIDIEGAFFFSTTRGICLVVSVGKEPQVGDNARTLPKALDVFNHNLVGNYMGIKFAPIGCTVAEKKYEPGITVGFSAAIMGVSFTALAKIDIPKLEMQVYANFDSFTIGGLRMKQTYLDLLVSGSRPLDSHVVFTGGFRLDLPSGPADVDLKVLAKFGSDMVFAVDGRVDSLVIVPGVIEVRRARLQGLVKPLELKMFVNLEGDVSILGSRATGAFRLDLDSSGVREVSANLDANVVLADGAVGVNGKFAFDYLKGGFPKLGFAGTLTAGGRQLASAEGQLDQFAFSVKARLDLGKVFNGQVDGRVVFCNPDGSIKIPNQAGRLVTGATGDFYLAATASVDVGVANATGTVRLGRTPTEDRVTRQACPVMAPTVISANADGVMSDAIGSTSTSATSESTSTTIRPATTTTTTTIAQVTTTSIAPTTAVAPLPLAPRSVWGDIVMDGATNLGPLQGIVHVAGNFDAAGNINLAVSGRLTVAPLANAVLSGNYVRTPDGQYTANLAFDANVLNLSQVHFVGAVRNGLYDFTGTGSLALGPVVRSDGSFLLSNVPGREGLRAGVNFLAGNEAVASVRGTGLLVFSGSWWDAEFVGTMRTPIAVIPTVVRIGNMRVRPQMRVLNYVVDVPCNQAGFPGGSITVSGQQFCTLNGPQLNAEASLTVFRQNFALSATITSTSFQAVASAPQSYDPAAAARGDERVMNYLGGWTVFWLPFRTVTFQAWWGGRLRVQYGIPNQPSIMFDGTAKGRFRWYFDVNCNAGLSGRFNPSQLGGRIDCGLGPVGFTVG